MIDPKRGFTFKRFFVAHDKSPMKVTTDSILLGAWSPLQGVEKQILDIGTGCGLIALMLAQRTADRCVQIDAVEIDHDAAEQARENCLNSPFSGAVNIVEQNIVDFAEKCEVRYDLIVSNPPYFSQGVPCRDEKRQQARYTLSLPHHVLLSSAAKLLKPEGQFCLVLPWSIEKTFKNEALAQGWQVRTQVNVNHIEGKPFTLVLFELIRTLSVQQIVELSIRNPHNSHYTEQFAAITQPFYLML